MKKTIYSALFAAAMLFGTNPAFAQVKIGTNPTVIDPNNNLEVESSTPGNKIGIHKTTGKITIADGSQGNKKVLTSDANGVATWEAPVQTTNLYVYARTPNTAYLQSITASNTNDGFNKLIMTNEVTDRAGNYDNTVSEITIPSDGIYMISGGTSKWSATTSGLSISLGIAVNGELNNIQYLLDGGTGFGVANNGNYHLRGTILQQFSANDKIHLSLRCSPVDSYAPTINFRESFLKMVKISN